MLYSSTALQSYVPVYCDIQKAATASASTDWPPVMHRLLQHMDSSGPVEGYWQRFYDACKRGRTCSVVLLPTLDTQVGHVRI